MNSSLSVIRRDLRFSSGAPQHSTICWYFPRALASCIRWVKWSNSWPRVVVKIMCRLLNPLCSIAYLSWTLELQCPDLETSAARKFTKQHGYSLNNSFSILQRGETCWWWVSIFDATENVTKHPGKSISVIFQPLALINNYIQLSSCLLLVPCYYFDLQ